MAAAPAYGVEAALRLRFEMDGDATVLTSCHQAPPWRVIRAFAQPGGEALVHLHNTSGGVLGGDRLRMDIHVVTRAKAQITSTSATRLYRSREGSLPSRQITRITADENAVVEYLPDPVIPYAGSDHRQSTEIELAAGACLFWWDTVTPGRYASGEAFRYERLDVDNAITVESRPVLRERFHLQPGSRALSGPVRFGAYTHMSSFYACQSGRDKAFWMRVETELTDLAVSISQRNRVIWGVSALAAHGILVRGLSTSGMELPSGLHEFWRAAKRIVTGRDAIRPRKIY